MTNSDMTVRASVLTAIAQDSRIPYPAEIAVQDDRGYVTLRGTVGSFPQQQAAVSDARRTPGVIEVWDDLRVRILDQDRREDAEIRGAALQRLIWDPDLPADALDVKVSDGWVTLEGVLDFQSQSDSAFAHVAALAGVTGVSNRITVNERR